MSDFLWSDTFHKHFRWRIIFCQILAAVYLSANDKYIWIPRNPASFTYSTRLKWASWTQLEKVHREKSLQCLYLSPLFSLLPALWIWSDQFSYSQDSWFAFLSLGWEEPLFTGYCTAQNIKLPGLQITFSSWQLFKAGLLVLWPTWTHTPCIITFWVLFLIPYITSDTDSVIRWLSIIFSTLHVNLAAKGKVICKPN